jgi:hypothetical protein
LNFTTISPFKLSAKSHIVKSRFSCRVTKKAAYKGGFFIPDNVANLTLCVTKKPSFSGLGFFCVPDFAYPWPLSSFRGNGPKRSLMVTPEGISPIKPAPSLVGYAAAILVNCSGFALARNKC